MKYFKPGLSIEELKREYKSLAKKYHPDVSNDPNADEIFKAINEEYKVYCSLLSKKSDKKNGNNYCSFYYDIIAYWANSKMAKDIFKDIEDWYDFINNRNRNTRNHKENTFVAFFTKHSDNTYKCKQYVYGSKYYEYGLDTEGSEENYEGFQCVYTDSIMPIVKISKTKKYSVPSDEAMAEYFIDEVSHDHIEWYGKESWIEYIKRRYSLNHYYSPDRENYECYGDTQTDISVSFDFYCTMYDVNSGLEEKVVKSSIDAKSAKYFKVKETVNWFDFPLKYYYGYTLDEFIKTYTIESFPPHATEFVYIDDLLNLFNKYGLDLAFSGVECILKGKRVPYHNNVIFCAFNLLNLVDYGEDVVESGINIKRVQEVMDKINNDSREKLKDLIKKGKVSSGI